MRSHVSSRVAFLVAIAALGALCAPGALVACAAKKVDSPAPKETPPLAPAMGAFDEANAHFHAGRYAEAAVAYERALASASGEEAGGEDWFQYGYALHVSGNMRRALEAHERATRFPQVAPLAAYNLACAHALLGNTDEAFAALDRAVGYGFRGLAQMEGDQDLASLHGDPRWEEMKAKVQKAVQEQGAVPAGGGEGSGG